MRIRFGIGERELRLPDSPDPLDGGDCPNRSERKRLVNPHQLAAAPDEVRSQGVIQVRWRVQRQVSPLDPVFDCPDDPVGVESESLLDIPLP